MKKVKKDPTKFQTNKGLKRKLKEGGRVKANNAPANMSLLVQRWSKEGQLKETITCKRNICHLMTRNKEANDFFVDWGSQWAMTNRSYLRSTHLLSSLTSSILNYKMCILVFQPINSNLRCRGSILKQINEGEKMDANRSHAASSQESQPLRKRRWATSARNTERKRSGGKKNNSYIQMNERDQDFAHKRTREREKCVLSQ